MRELAQRSGVHYTTINRLEAERGEAHPLTAKAIEDTFRKAGVELIPENGGGVGVRLRKRSRS
jgi:hypothetical protein